MNKIFEIDFEKSAGFMSSPGLACPLPLTLSTVHCPKQRAQDNTTPHAGIDGIIVAIKWTVSRTHVIMLWTDRTLTDV